MNEDSFNLWGKDGVMGNMGGLINAGSSLFGVSTDGGPLATLTEAIAALFIVLSLVLYIVSIRG